MSAKLTFLPLLALPTLALAQATPAPRFYLGVGGSLGLTRVFRGDFAPPAAVGGVLTGGWQPAPRLAVQLSPSLQGSGEQGSYPLHYQGADQPPTGTARYSFRNLELAVPLLLRYTLTAPTGRVRFKALAGAAWVRLTFTDRTTTTANDGTVLSDAQATAPPYSFAALLLGPAVRYGLRPRFGLAASLPLRYELRGYFSDFYVPGFRDHLLLQPQLSAQYLL